MTGRIVIVGAGIAGATAARTLRREGYTGAIVLIGAETSLPYRRPMVSKELLAGTAYERRMLIETAEAWRAHDIDLRLGIHVDGLDTARARIELADGSTLGYDALLLATGARARRLPNPQRHIHTLRELGDIAPLRAELRDGGTLLVIGAGVLGCETAATARVLGAQATIVHAGRAPLDRIAPPLVGDYFRNLHAANGVAIHDDITLTRLAGTADGVTATAADGHTWDATAALVAIGSEPNTDLARAAGLAVDNGIVVDDHHRTSAPAVFAAGDVANRLGERTEHWNSAQEQGSSAAKAILGQPLPPRETPWGWTTQYGRNLQFAGHFHPDDTIILRGVPEAHDFTVLAIRDDRVTAAATLARPAEFRAARNLISRNAIVDPDRCADEATDLRAYAAAIAPAHRAPVGL
ncbi:NAD(P)/FAD-dependent oxidoreductase [Nocardia pseudobrasiliensis]|uniref:NAD/ferredoxin-dependent reductase-like protein n=1 Tax=Nocardia pseudobrasiliensis TaxID=45979 RepID=A0A370IDQ4_9NOCA|nr:FAD-dependent oxidoreductase [Nocardia pseudobrasiliensis]RDI67554.1 NAD/ferredoxin-dependent reductase-like protein [Nocardia pseudobrasiliensis]